MSMWPNKGELDKRPLQSEGYKKMERISPRSPIVPATAPAALF